MNVQRLRSAGRAVVTGGAVRSSSWSMLGQASAMLAGTANFLLLARLIGPADYGLVAAAWALVLTTGPIAMMGADRLLVRDVAATTGDGARHALGAALLSTALGSTLAVLLLAGLHPVLLPQVPLALLVSLGLADILALGLATCVAALFFSAGKAREAGLSTTAVSMAKLTAVIAFAIVDGEDVTTWALLYAGLSLLSGAAQVLWAVRHVGRPDLSGYRLRTRVREGLPYSGNQAALVVLNDVDKALLVRNGFAEGAGHYSVAYRLATIASLPVLAVLQVTFPRFFACGSTGGLAATAALARRLLPVLCAYAVVAGLGLLALAPLLPVLVGEEYRESVWILMVLAPLPLLTVLQSIWSDALTGAGRQSTRTTIVTVAAATNLAMNLVLLPHYGIGAALSATLVAETLYVVLVGLALRRGLAREAAAEPVASSPGPVI